MGITATEHCPEIFLRSLRSGIDTGIWSAAAEHGF